MAKLKHCRTIKKDEDVVSYAVRVSKHYHIDWQKVLSDKLVFSLSCYEVAGVSNHHTHSAIQLSRPMKKTTFIERLKKHYPDLKGKEMFAVGVWDDDEAYLRYICKDVHEKYPRDDVVYQCHGTRWELKSPDQYNREYHIINKELKEASKIRKPDNIDIIKYVKDNFNANYSHQDCASWSVRDRREILAKLIFGFYTTTGKQFHGNYHALQSMLNSIELDLFKTHKSFEDYFVDRVSNIR